MYVWTPCLSALASLRTPGPQSGGRAGRLELLVVKYSGHWIVHSHVEVATNEVHVEAHHVRVKTLWQERFRVEENGHTVVVCAGVELGGHVRDVMVGLSWRNCVGRRRAQPAFHCRNDTWRRSLTASVTSPSKSGFGFPKVVRGMTRGEPVSAAVVVTPGRSCCGSHLRWRSFLSPCFAVPAEEVGSTGFPDVSTLSSFDALTETAAVDWSGGRGSTCEHQLGDAQCEPGGASSGASACVTVVCSSGCSTCCGSRMWSWSWCCMNASCVERERHKNDRSRRSHHWLLSQRGVHPCCRSAWDEQHSACSCHRSAMVQKP